MKAGIQTDEGTVAPGKIRFFDTIEPPLEAGEYRLSASHQVLDIPGETVTPYISDQEILIDGPRFALAPKLIHTTYPPANLTGSYDNVLPNVVFNNFSLPWSRPIDPAVVSGEATLAATSQDGNKVPWIGLLTIYPGDMEVKAGKAKVSEPVTMTVAELIKPKESNVLAPAIVNLFGAGANKVNTVDMDIAYFQSIAPTLAELPFLAHARSVNTGGKALLGMDDDGCFSLLIGNRLPQGGAKNTVFIVSYEGHQAHLKGNTIAGAYTTIRLVLLGSWEFTSSPARGSFIQLMADLCLEGRGGVSLLQMDEAPATKEISPIAAEALETGYTALQQEMRQGEDTTAWYRGPLMPAPTKRDHAYGPYHYSDHAIHYDPATGIFNHSYSAAWQIGRLLALSDASFSQALFQWRNKYLKAVIDNARKVGPEKIFTIAGKTAQEAVPEDLVAAVRTLFSAGFRQVAWPQVKQRSVIMQGEEPPGIFTAAEKLALTAQEEDPILMIAKKIKGEEL